MERARRLGVGWHMYSKKSLNAYRASAPINFRLILINLLLIGGCAFIIFECIDRYSQALDDLDHVARLSAAGNAPCGMAVPKTKFLLQALKEITDDAFTEESESIYVSRIRGAFCGASTPSNALRAALQTTEIPEECCNERAPDGSEAPPAAPSIDLNDAVKEYICKCDTQECGNGDIYGDFIRRITTAYVQSAPAFARYVDSGGANSRCTGDFDPWAPSVCTNVDANDLINEQLSEAAENSMGILSGAPASEQPFPEIKYMLYRLMALSVVEYHDRTDGTGACFKNTELEPDPIEFCKTMLDASSARSRGTSKINGCVNPSDQTYYVERIKESDSCTWTAASGTEAERLKIEPEPRNLRRFTADYATATPVIAVCSSMLEFGLLDRKRLFGLPDPIAKFEWYSENHGNSFTRWLAGWMYYSLFDKNVASVVSELHTPYLDLKLYLGYRLAATSAWCIAAMCAAGYLLMFAAVPIAKLLYVRLVRSNLTDSKNEPIVLKPLGGAEYVALITAGIVGLWVIFVDPGAYTPYVFSESCADYELHGGPFTTTELRPRDGLVGLVLCLLSAGLLIYLFACRRKPKKDRVIPLQPFPIWPILSLIIIVLIAVLVLALRAGSDWWISQSTDLSSSNTKTTDDFEEIIGAAFWVMLFLGGLLGVLNQRHMAASAVLEVPIGRPPVFAFIWVGFGVALAAVAAVFTWPLFDCQLAWSTNKFVCGDGSAINIRWNRFFGCIAWGACVLAVVFVVFASYRVLFKVPRKNDITSLAFNKSRDQKVNLLAAKRNEDITRVAEDRFGLKTPSTNPFGTGNSISYASFVAIAENDNDPLVLSPQNAPIMSRSVV